MSKSFNLQSAASDKVMDTKEILDIKGNKKVSAKNCWSEVFFEKLAKCNLLELKCQHKNPVSCAKSIARKFLHYYWVQIQDINAFHFDFEMQIDNRPRFWEFMQSSNCLVQTFSKTTSMQASANSHQPLGKQLRSDSRAFLPICEVVVVIIRQTLPKKVTVTQVTRLEVIGIQAFDKLNAWRTAEVASRWHCVGCVLWGGLAALVSTSGRRSVARLKARARLAMAPGKGWRAVRETGDAASVGLITVIAHVAAVQTAGGKRGKRSLKVTLWKSGTLRKFVKM